MKIISSEMQKNSQDRSKVYMLLSRFFLKKPDRELLIKLQDKNFLKHIKNSTPKIEEEFGGALKLIEKFIRSSKNIPEEKIIEDLSVEFTRLFRGIKVGYSPPPPYESIYMGEGKIMGDTTSEIMEIYEEAGIGMMELFEGPPDYIGTELKFSSLICFKESEAWGKNQYDESLKFLNIEFKFLNNHACRWIPNFCSLMEKEAKSEFYKGIAGLTKAFLTMDRKQVQTVLEGFKIKNP